MPPFKSTGMLAAACTACMLIGVAQKLVGTCSV